MLSIFSLSFSKLQDILLKNDFKAFHARQIFAWIYKRRNFDPSTYSDLSTSLRSFLQDHFSYELPRVVQRWESKDGTIKQLLQLSDQRVVESVLIKQFDRYTICLSTQIGCPLHCLFCYSGQNGWVRNLSVAEIVGQYLLYEQAISNIVYMGQGEPLLNYEAVKEATDIFMHPWGLYLGARKITLSTAGIVDRFDDLNRDFKVNLAISLHAPNDKLRSQIMPINKQYSLQKLFAALDQLDRDKFYYITFEYMMIDSFNDGEEQLQELIKLLKGRRAKVNLIPCNNVPQSSFTASSDRQMQYFQKRLNEQHIVCTIRQSKGADIMAACGQLQSSWQNERG